jgi:hypothetical protein
MGVIQIVADNLKKAYLEYKANQDEQGRISGPSGLTLRSA